MSSHPRIPHAVLMAILVAAAACSSERSAPEAPAGLSASDVPRTTVAATTVAEPMTPAPGVSAPTYANVTYEDAEAAYAAGRYNDAVAMFNAYTDRKPSNVWGEYMLGLSSWKAGDPERAVEAFDRALAIDSTHEKSLLNSSRVLIELKRPEDALERIAKVLDTDSLDNEALRLQARAYYTQGDKEAAIKGYLSALRSNERDEWSLNNLGLIYLEMGDAERALPVLARAVELRGNAPVFRNNLGIALERTGHPAAARDQYQAALEADSTYSKAAVSLERVTPIAEVAPPDSIDLGLKASEFVMMIRTQ